MALTELVFILDKSGSMAGLEDDTIGGYNALLAQQREVEGTCLVTTVLFDHGCEVLHDGINLKTVQPLTRREYQVGGSTALLDAMGRTIHQVAARQRTAVESRAARVMVVIITDGQENSSVEFSPRRVQQLVAEQREQHGWEFIFLGANMDAIAAAAQCGIGAERAQRFHADGPGLTLSFAALNETVAAYRASGQVHGRWKEKIAADYVGRRPRG